MGLYPFFFLTVFLLSYLVTVGASGEGTSIVSQSPPISRTDCTLYASPLGDNSNSGTSPTRPLTLRGAVYKTIPGDVVCLLSGTYTISSTLFIAHSGRAGGWITYKNHEGGAELVWNGSGPDPLLAVENGTKYIEIRGLRFNGSNKAATAISCHKARHLRIIGNTVSNAGADGIGSVLCDYMTIVGNKVYHTGYGTGWGSGISLNSNQWSDNYQGFHNFVIGNIISGSVDNSSHHTDGNGIIMDLSKRSYDYSSADSPPTLIANNLVFENGGRCIHTFVVTNIWIVNNTCYKNGLDPRLGENGEFSTSKSKNIYFINNIAYAWNNQSVFEHDGPNSNVVYFRNAYFGGNNSGVPSSINSDPSKVRKVDPIFVNPPVLDPRAKGQYGNALSPNEIGNRLTLKSNSLVIDAGIDPTTVPGVNVDIIKGLKQYIFKDINGNLRPRGNGFDPGAYEH